MSKKVLIVGAGLGSLSTALRLNHQGYEVHIVEKNNQAGGRLNRIQQDGYTFDTGPSFFSMSYEFEELAKACEMELGFDYFPLDPLYSVHLKKHNKKFYMYKDIKKLAAQFVDIEPDFEEKMHRYLKECEQTFHDTVDVVIKRNFNSLGDYLLALMQVDLKHLPKLTRNFWQQVKRYFKSSEARELISLVAFFLGKTPFDTPAIYTLLSYTEFQHDGYHNVKGGMYQITEAFVKTLQKRGVQFHFNTEIVGVQAQGEELQAFIDQQANEWRADCFIANSDAAYFRNKVLKRKAFSDAKMRKKNWTMGYLTIYLGVNTKLNQLDHHNYFIGENYEDYSSKLLKRNISLEKPYYYVNVLSQSNDNCAPEGCESLFIVCPVPNLQYKIDWSDRDAIIDSIVEDLSEKIGADIRPHIQVKQAFTPQEWQDRFNLYQGSGLGLSHDILQIGHLRPKNFDEEFRNLFYVGASTVPGAGLPMAVISGKLAAERVTDYLPS